MSKQRNKRNARRGRAKRWTNFYGGWFLRRVEHSPRASSLNGDGWEVVVWDRDYFTFRFPNRAAAMRAAEYLARGR